MRHAPVLLLRLYQEGSYDGRYRVRVRPLISPLRKGNSRVAPAPPRAGGTSR
jgi:hypothetical protein